MPPADPGVPIEFDLVGLGVHAIEVDGVPTPFEYDEGKLRVLAGAGATDTVEVVVAYGGTPDDGLILGDNVHGEAAAFADNWPNRARFWFPSVDHPSDKATVAYTIHAPARWQVIANGALQAPATPTGDDALGGGAGGRRTWRWATSVPIPSYTMVVGGAELAVHEVGLAACGASPASPRSDGCTRVTYWVYPQDTASGARIFGRAAEMVDFFTDLIGPFPYEKLANVQSATRFGGMENASAIFYTERGIAEGRDMEATVSHEIAHQWFGDSVTESEWYDLWLSEGFATYFGALFFEAADGPADFRRRMEESRERVLASDDVRGPVIDPAESDLFRLLNDNNYPKGGWVLHMLRGMLGDDVFFAGIRSYYARFRDSLASTADFRATMEEASGTELGWFFEQWLHRPGYPVIASRDHLGRGSRGGGRHDPADAAGGLADVPHPAGRRVRDGRRRRAPAGRRRREGADVPHPARRRPLVHDPGSGRLRADAGGRRLRLRGRRAVSARPPPARRPRTPGSPAAAAWARSRPASRRRGAAR